VSLAGYLAAEGFEPELEEELGGAVVERHGRLLLAEGPPRAAAWAQNVWLDPRELPIASIADAARKLRAIQRNWALLSVTHHRRGALVEAALPRVSFRPIPFPSPLPAAPLGSFALLAPDRLLASPRCSSPFRHGEVEFVEDRAGPPNRAYLKLWEIFTLLQRMPGPGDACVDLGSSPGGWTFVLARLGASVLSVDRAPLAADVGGLGGVEFRRMSAFALEPRPVRWLFSDVICYPRRLLALVRSWLGAATNLVCTIKFQGATDHAAVRDFAAIPNARLLHLSHNKHELTFVRIGDEEGAGRPGDAET
jgi:23S rRNA (cytidine2498-2'-O)-methyltransferase